MSQTRPLANDLCIDLYAGLGGWADGFLSEGYDVIGFDIERHDYGTGGYPGQLVLQDVTTLHGSQFKDAAVIVASPPCQAYSYMAMPWKRAKQIARALRGKDEFPKGYKGSRTVSDLNVLFDSCFRLQREASEAAGRYIPLLVENVRGAEPWVGGSRWHHGSFYLWGDVPALMPFTNGRSVKRYREEQGVKQNGSGPEWFDNGIAKHSSKSDSRKAASAQIAKIPFPLAQHIARVFKPDVSHETFKLVVSGS